MFSKLVAEFESLTNLFSASTSILSQLRFLRCLRDILPWVGKWKAMVADRHLLWLATKLVSLKHIWRKTAKNIQTQLFFGAFFSFLHVSNIFCPNKFFLDSDQLFLRLPLFNRKLWSFLWNSGRYQTIVHPLTWEVGWWDRDTPKSYLKYQIESSLLTFI